MAEEDFSPDLAEAGGSGSDRITIENRFVVETTRRVADLAGCPAFGVKDTLSPNAALVALAPTSTQPARAEVVQMARVRSPHLLAVHAVDESSGALWLICDAPAGPVLSVSGMWTESTVLERVIQPIAAVLHAYQAADLTHRAIRPDNVFDPGGRSPVRLGPGLTTPPALFQPAQFEPISSLLCVPAARGNGTIADDVFALGALAAWLMGGCPAPGTESFEQMLEERITRGSFDVLAGHLPLAPDVLSLLAAMLSDDATTRPSPSDLLNVSVRKAFVARKPPVAATPIQIGSVQVRTPRALAWYGARYQAELANLLRRGVVERWFTHELGMTATAGRLVAIGKELAINQDALPSPIALMEIIATLDPGLPMLWRGVWLWPDSVPTLAVAALAAPAALPNADLGSSLPDLLEGSAFHRFAQISAVPGQMTIVQKIVAAARQGDGDRSVDLSRVAYLSNPVLPCLSQKCITYRFSMAWALLQWLDGGNATVQSGQDAFLDTQMRAFLLARAQRNGFGDRLAGGTVNGPLPWFADLKFLAILQKAYETGPLPGIGRKMLPHLTSVLNIWRNKAVRAKRADGLAVAAEAGDLTVMVSVCADPRAIAKDREDWMAAQKEIRSLTHDQAVIERETTDLPPRVRSDMVQVATAIGTLAAILSLCFEVVS